MTPPRPYAIPQAPGDSPLPRDAEAWTDMAAEIMPLLNDVIVATQECERDHALAGFDYPRDRCWRDSDNDDGGWSCTLIDPAVSAVLAWAEGKL